MNRHQPTDIMFLAGGTGGHVIPADVLENFFSQHGLKTLFVTDQRGESYLKEETRQKALVLRMTRGSFLKRLWGVLKNTCILIKKMKQLSPKSVIGFGGYPSAAGGLAALFLGIPLFLHEQNAILGRVNRLLVWFSKGLFLTFPNTQKVLPRFRSKVFVTGPLVRPDIEHVGENPYRAWSKNREDFRILVLGGSQGSKGLVEDVLKSLSLLKEKECKKIFLTFQIPQSFQDQAQKSLDLLGMTYESAPFFSDMSERLRRSHLVIGRSGASMVCESLASQRPALFVPLPSAMDDHQTYNALSITDHKAGWCLPQDSEISLKMAQFLEDVMDHPEELTKASQRLLKLYSRGGAQKIFEKMNSLLDLKRL